MIRNHVTVELRRLVRRQVRHALVVSLFRGLWLGLAVLVVGPALHLLDRPVPWRVVIAAAGLPPLLSLLRALWHHPSPAHLARRLDRYFGLREQIATAYEVGQRGAVVGDVQARLIAQAGATLRRLRRHPALTPRFPLREVETLLALVLVAGGLWLWRETGSGLPVVARRQLPPAIVDPVAAPVRRAAPRLPPEAREAVARLAEALRQNSLTRGAGEALAQGDAAGAAEALRALADRLDQLTPGERADLADALRGAADALGSDMPEMRAALDRAADRAERGSAAEAAEALEELAREIEKLGEPQAPVAAAGEESADGEPGAGGENSGTSDAAEAVGEQSGTQGAGRSNSAGEGSGGQTQASAPPEELGTEGIPLELDPGEEGPPTNQPARDGETPGGQPQRARGFTRGGAPDPQVVETGADPQRYPWELRGAVRDYFQPGP